MKMADLFAEASMEDFLRVEAERLKDLPDKRLMMAALAVSHSCTSFATTMLVNAIVTGHKLNSLADPTGAVHNQFDRGDEDTLIYAHELLIACGALQLKELGKRIKRETETTHAELDMFISSFKERRWTS